MKLTHVRLLVDDAPACFRFYRDVIGLTPTWGTETKGYADFDAGGSTLAILGRAGQAEVVELRDTGDGAILVFGVDDLEAALAGLRARGAEPGEIVDRPDWGIRFAHLRDPDGNLVEVSSPIRMEWD